MSTPNNAAIQAWLDQEDAFCAEMVCEHGFCIQFVWGDPDAGIPTFAYTIGLFGIGHAELFVTGTSDRTAHALFTDLFGCIEAGRLLMPGEVLSFEHWAHRVTVETVPNPAQIAFGANRFYRLGEDESVDLLQLTYDDLEGRFPWEEGYSRPAWLQPRPGEVRA